jgi:hypothetical protein
MKPLGATFLLAAVAFLNFHLFRCAKKGTPLNFKVMRIITPINRTSLVFALLGVAVLTTTV